jgi:flagellar assembly protein FliH
MLSKVLSRRDSGPDSSRVQAMVFPSLGSGAIARPSIAVGGVDPGQGAGEIAALREKVRQLESRLATERREAVESGRQQGDQQARAELEPILERLNASISEIVALGPDLRSRAERDVVQFALLIAKRVLHRQLAVDEGALTALARVTFERLTRSESYTITVNPRFAAAITSVLPSSHASRVKIQPDPDCPAGTLTIHSAEGLIDASIDTQLEEIGRGLADRLAGG